MNTSENVSRPAEEARAVSSRCCLQPLTTWIHWREGKAGDYATKTTVVICSKCHGPADGSRPEEYDERLPWHLVRGPVGDESETRFVRREA